MAKSFRWLCYVYKRKPGSEKITEGEYDTYLAGFAGKIRQLNRPVYIRFAPEADNPFYPWSASGGNTADDFNNAWKYIHNYFIKEAAYNAIWVWNPWKATAINDYFPGNNYVDWIGITNLNYGAKGPGKKWYSMEQLYEPFHQQSVITSGIPVMLAEMGSLRSAGQQKEWFKQAANSVKNKFPEIKAYVLFNTRLDKKIPLKTDLKYLDWQVKNPDIILTAANLETEKVPAEFLVKNSVPALKSKVNILANMRRFEKIKGINYTKGLNWSENYNTLRNNEILVDLEEIKQMGFNTIKRYGPDVYDYNIFTAAELHKLNINYGFYIPESIDFLKDQKLLEELDKEILQTVIELKNDKKIIAWNFGNTPLQKFENQYYKPELIYYQYAYANWLKNLIRKIKLEDPGRPVTVDLEVTPRLPEMVSFMKDQIPGIDIFGLVINENSPSSFNFKQLGVPYFISKINPIKYLDQHVQNEGFFIADWQDQQRNNLVSFDGLKDNWGRNKVVLYQLKKRFGNLSSTNLLTRVKTLRPATTIFGNKEFTYHVLVEVKNEWKLADSIKNGLKYDWYLVKTDTFGNGISMIYLATGPSLSFRVPHNPWEYQLYLNASRGKDVTTAKSILNIPLVSPEGK